MPTFVAHYRSPSAASERAKGLFEFASSSRLGTKDIAHEARVRMLELFGKDAVSWSIDRIERKRATAQTTDGQLEMDFRTPKRTRARAAKKEYW